MRDSVIFAVVAVLLIATFRYPVVGAYTWAWLSLMNPHKLTYGLAFDFPFAQVCALVTILALLFSGKRQSIPINSLTVVYLLLLLWITVTSFFAIASPADVFSRWVFVMKIQFMMFVTIMLITGPKQLRTLIWVVTFSVAFYGIKGGIFTVLTGGSQRVWGPPGGMIEENNALAVCLVMLVPMLYFLWQTEVRRWVRYVLVFCIVAITFSILGSQSRGALLALSAMAFFLGLKGKHPVRTSLILALLMVTAISFMPDTWTSRMETMESYTTDDSAMSRIWSWHTMWNAAVDRPLVGAGLQADNPTVFARYAPQGGEFAVFAGRVYVAHSIYLQMLGEQGFVGLGLFLLLGLLTWRMAGRLARRTKDDAEFGGWMPLLMRMVQVSLIGYGVGGAFLSLAYFDVPYYFVAFVVLCDAMVRARLRSVAAADAGASRKLGDGPLIGTPHSSVAK